MKARQGAWRRLRRAGIALAALSLLAVGFAAGAEGSPVLIADNTFSEEQIKFGGGNVLGSEFPRERVRSVTFVDTLAHAPSDAWDVSAAGDRSVLAWLAPRGELADLYIGGAGGVALNEDSSYLFAHYKSLEIVRFNGCVDASGARNLHALFYNCQNLREVNLANFDTSSATDMGYMFESCASLESLDLRSFDTSNVTDMSCMFAYCELLERVDAGENFFPAGVLGAGDMFDNAGVDSVAGQRPMGESVPMADTNEGDAQGEAPVDVQDEMSGDVQDEMSGDVQDEVPDDAQNEAPDEDQGEQIRSVLMADACDLDALASQKTLYALGSDIPRSAVRSVRFTGDLSSAPEGAWDVSDAGDGSVLAWAAPSGSLYDLTIAGNGRVIIENGDELFAAYDHMEELDFNGCVDTSENSGMEAMFYGCAELDALDLSGVETGNVTDMSMLFFNCAGLTSLDLSGFDTGRATTMALMFGGCSRLASLDLSGFNTRHVRDMQHQFHSCVSLTSLNLSGFDTRSVTNMECQFADCMSLTSLDLSGFETRNVTNMSGMFSGCWRLEELNIRNFDTRNVTDMSEMFRGTGALPDVKVGENFIVGNDVKQDDMFEGSMLID